MQISCRIFFRVTTVKRIVLIAIPVLLALAIFVPIQNRVIYWSLFAAMFVLVYLYHVMEDVVPVKDVVKSLGTSDFFSLKCGYVEIKDAKAELRKGLMVIYGGTVLFYVRARATGGASLVQSIAAEAIETYTMCKVDDYHQGVTFTLNGGDEVKFTSKKIASMEKEMRAALGWPEEEKTNPEA